MYLHLQIPDNLFSVYVKLQSHGMYLYSYISPFIMYYLKHLMMFTCKQSCLQTCKYGQSLSVTETYIPTKFNVDIWLPS